MFALLCHLQYSPISVFLTICHFQLQYLLHSYFWDWAFLTSHWSWNPLVWWLVFCFNTGVSQEQNYRGELLMLVRHLQLENIVGRLWTHKHMHKLNFSLMTFCAIAIKWMKESRWACAFPEYEQATWILLFLTLWMSLPHTSRPVKRINPLGCLFFGLKTFLQSESKAFPYSISRDCLRRIVLSSANRKYYFCLFFSPALQPKECLLSKYFLLYFCMNELLISLWQRPNR